MSIIVSISCITYNHESYIRECLDSFLMQKTNFSIEVVIHDDCSSDGTREIIEEYATKYPDIIFPMFQNENQYSTGVRGMMARFNFPRCRGKYIAICEGDDYWNDALKLQKQLDYMEKNPDCSLCFHSSVHLNEANNEQYYIHKPINIPTERKFVMKDAILGGGSFITTNSMFFHQQHITILPDWFLKAPVGDLPLMLLLATKGKIGYIDEVMSTYRLMSNNSWSFTMQDKKKKKTHYHSVLKMWNDFDKWTNYKFYGLILRKKIKNYYSYWKQILYLKKELALKKIKSKH